MKRMGPGSVASHTGGEDSPPCFLVDSMLGRLARWLRILGYDTWYFRDISDEELVGMQRRSGRVLLTRDRALIRHGCVEKFVFIEADCWEDQMEEVMKVFPLAVTRDRLFTRCLRCNDRLERVASAEVRGRVADFVAAAHDTFHRCPSCDRIYWPGTHREEMLQKIERFVDTVL